MTETDIPASDKRTKLLEAAYQLICAEGIDDLPVSKITDTAGVAKGTFYLYFPSKDDLLTALANNIREAILRDVLQTINPTQSFFTTLATVIRTATTSAEKHRAILGHLDLQELLPQSNGGAVGLATLLRQVQVRGEISANLDAQVYAELISNTMTHLAKTCIRRFSTDGPEKQHYIEETIMFLTRSLQYDAA